MDLAQAATNVLAPLGFEVLEVDVSGKKDKRRVLLRIDRLDEGIVSMEDVALATDVFGLELDRLDPFSEPYSLNVTSPGSERPLFTARHFERFHDLAVKVRHNGDTFKGVVREVQGDEVLLEVGGKKHPYKLGTFKANLAEWPDKPR